MKTSSFVVLLIVLASSSAQAGRPLGFWKPVDSVAADRTIGDAAIADINQDGRVDALVSLPDTGLVQLLLGSGDGRFSPAATYAVAPGRGDLVLADVNGDGISDLLVASLGIAALLGNPDGTFGAPMYSGGSGMWMVAADFDRDGHLDVASVGKNFPSSGIPRTVDVYRGNGDGSFAPPQYMFVSDNGVRAISTGDLNGDGWPDLVIGESDARALHVYLNQGDLTFAAAARMFIEVGPAATAVADIDGNGMLDVLTADFTGTVSLFLGNGDGTLQPARVFPVGTGPTSLDVVDIDLDGRPDVIVALDAGAVAVLLNAGAGVLAAPVRLDTGGHASFAVGVDVDNDGGIDVAAVHTDAAFAEAGNRILSVYRNKLRTTGQQRSSK
jgi:hypothetical protein